MNAAGTPSNASASSTRPPPAIAKRPMPTPPVAVSGGRPSSNTGHRSSSDRASADSSPPLPARGGGVGGNGQASKAPAAIAVAGKEAELAGGSAEGAKAIEQPTRSSDKVVVVQDTDEILL